jgi:hypothetical protein
MMIARRRLMLVACLALMPRLAFARPPVAGCCLRTPLARSGLFAGSGAAEIVAPSHAEDKLITSSGDAGLDHALGRALLRLAQGFEVYPGFGFIDDRDGENAYAAREQRIAGTEGTVYFGLNLFRRTMARFDDGGMAVLAICAHEFAHIYQFRSGYHKELTDMVDGKVRLAELHADFLAGYFLARRKAEFTQLDIQGAGALIESLGDTEFSSPEHHGTPAQRVRAIEGGYSYGKAGTHAIGEAAREGSKMVLSQFA